MTVKAATTPWLCGGLCLEEVRYTDIKIAYGSVWSSSSECGTRGQGQSLLSMILMTYLVFKYFTTLRIRPHLISRRCHCVASEIYGLSSRDVVYMASPLTFDPSVVEIFTTLSSGATLLISNELTRLRPRDLLRLLTTVHHVTVLQVINVVSLNIKVWVYEKFAKILISIFCFAGIKLQQQTAVLIFFAGY